MKWMSWPLVFVAAFFAVVGVAPFSAGTAFPAISMPLAALMAWRGEVWPPLLITGIAVFGFAISIVPLESLLALWQLPAWMVLWAGVMLAGLLWRGRKAQVHADQG